MLEEQGEQLGGTGQPAEGDRAHLVGSGVGVARSQDLGDPSDSGLHPHRVAGLDAGDHRAEAVLVGPARGDVAAAELGLDLLLVPRGVGLDDLGLGDGEHPSTRLTRDDPRDRPVDHAGRPRESLATRRAM
jgi:hypothetical protein